MKQRSTLSRGRALAGACWLVLGVAAALASLAGTPVARAQPAASQAGFASHGVPVPLAQPRGIVSTVDGEGRDVVLVWLQDHRGGYSLLQVDAETGVWVQVDVPFNPGEDEPFAVWLSSKNRLYTLFNHQFLEFDVASRRFTLVRRTRGKTAMSLTEDRDGTIWAATYPDNSLVGYDPVKGILTGFGPLAEQDWPQYPRSMAADAQGWIYVGVGTVTAQIHAFHPASGARRSLLPSSGQTVEVLPSAANVVVGRQGERRFLLSGGQIGELPAGTGPAPAAQPGGMQNFVKRDFPSGRQLLEVDLAGKRLVTRNAAGETQSVRFDYRTEGAALTFVCATPTHVCGGTRFPMQAFRFAPAGQAFSRVALPRQPNVMLNDGERIYVAGYPDGRLYRSHGPLEGGAAGAAAPGAQAEAADGAWARFEQLASGDDVVYRPHALLLTGRDAPAGAVTAGSAGEAGAAGDAGGAGAAGGASQGAQRRWAVVGGTPAYGRRGGGLLFWPLDGGKPTVLTDGQLIPGHAVQTLIELPDGLLLGGTTTAPGTGGEQAPEGESARIFLFDPARTADRVRWSSVPVPGARVITDLLRTADGLVWGIADSHVLFALDPARRTLVRGPRDFSSTGRSVFAQGTRALLSGGNENGADVTTVPGTLFVLLTDGVGHIDPSSGELTRLATSPAPITAGGAWHDNRLWFASGSQLHSWKAPD